MMTSERLVIGLDFGTDSVRAVLVNSDNGETLASHVHWYQRWKEGKFCDPSSNQYRQHPLDHLEGMEATIVGVMQQSKADPGSVKGICIDTTGSSPIAVDQSGQPLCFKQEFEDNPNAMVVLWKDHTAIAEAEEINQLARTWGGEDFTKYEGGIYSSEWFWSKILHVVRNDAQVAKEAYSWMEHCDLMTYLLLGSPGLASFKRSRCAAGHKAMWHQSWGGLPHEAFLGQLHLDFPKLKKQLYQKTYTSDEVAGNLSAQWAKKLGLTENTVISVGTFDAHAGAVGAEVEEYTLVRVMGTSTCDIIVSSPEALGDNTVRGICGQVDGSVIPGMIGLEAGQSAFGDLLAWFKEVISWPIDNFISGHFELSPEEIEKVKEQLLVKLSQEAEQVPLTHSMPIAMDWINGRRTPDADQSLKAAIVNLSLGTKAPEIFRALVESICFGSRMIVERFKEEGVAIKSVVGIGGVAKKSSFIMQTLADVLAMPIKVARSEQAPALGAAMYAAVAAGLHEDLHEAIKKMGNGFEKIYQPKKEMTAAYEQLFKRYKLIGNFIEHNLSSDVEIQST